MVPEQGSCRILKSNNSPGFLSVFFFTISIFFSPLQFENIKVVEAQNTEVLMSGKSDLKELLKEKRCLEVKIQGLHSMVTTHTNT